MLVDHLLKTKKKYKNLKKQEIHDIFIKKKLIKLAFFQHGMVYGDFQYLPRKTATDKVTHDEAFHIAKNAKYDRYQRDIASLVYKFLDKNSSAKYANKFCSGAVKSEIISN